MEEEEDDCIQQLVDDPCLTAKISHPNSIPLDAPVNKDKDGKVRNTVQLCL